MTQPVWLEKNFGPWRLHYWFPSLKFIFWRSKKVASGATATALVKWSEAIEQRDGLERHTFFERIDPQTVRALMAQDANTTCVGLWRHPLDRLVSAWHFPFEQCVSFSNFCHTIHAAPDDLINRHLAPQSWHLPRDIPTNRLHLNRLEDMPESWVRIQRHTETLDPEPLPDLKLQNPSDHGHWSDYFTPELEALMRARYHQDLEVMSYA